MLMLPHDAMLWAGDFVQVVDAPSLYAKEVIEAAGRAGFAPTRFAAQHVPVTDWQLAVSMNRAGPAPGG